MASVQDYEMAQHEGADSEGDWETDSGDEIEEEQAAKCLFSDDLLPSVTAALEHDATHFGFDFHRYVKKARLDDYGVIKCVNFIRAAVEQKHDPRSDLAAALSTPEKPWDDDKYLFPVLQNDSLLCHEFNTSEDPSQQRMPEPAAPSKGTTDTNVELEQLKQENAALRTALQQACLADMAPEVADELQGGAGLEALGDMDLGDRGAAKTNGGASTTGTHISMRTRGGRPRSMRDARVERADESYFDSYGHFDIHRTMISDKVRTDAYQRALEGNPMLMKGAAVLDVGCGTGILSMFAARGGAAQITAVEGSKRMAEQARSIVAENKLDSASGGPITIVSARMEDVDSLPQVDVIVSEWMGYALFFESMLDSVIYARDRWLKPGGAVLPDLASIHMAGAGAGALDLEFWNDVYGFSYRPVQNLLLEASLKDAIVAPVDARHLLTAPCCLRSFDIATMSAADTEFSTEFVLEAAPSATGAAAECHALVLWFDTEFSARFCKEQPGLLSTSPLTQQTHWAQTILTLREPVLLQTQAAAAEGGAASLRGRLSFGRSDKHRCLDISLECQAYSAQGAPAGSLQTQLYSIATAGN